MSKCAKATASASAVMSLALLVSACGTNGIKDSADTGTDPAVSVSEVYVIPDNDPTAPGAIYGLLVTDGVAGTAALLGYGTDVIDAASSIGRGVLSWTSEALGVILAPITSDGSGDTNDVGSIELPRAVLSVGENTYLQKGDEIVSSTADGLVHVADLPDVVSTDIPTGYKGIYRGTDSGTVSVLARNSAGALIAGSSTGFGAAISNLSTGDTQAVAGYDTLAGGDLGTDGMLYVLASKPYDANPTYTLLQVDLDTLAVTDSWPTNIGYSDDVLRTRVLNVPGTGIVVGVSHGDDTSIADEVAILANDAISSVGSIPSNTGLDFALATPGSIYVYGGPALNHVSVLDLTTGALSAVSALSAPTGSYIVDLRNVT